MSYKARVFTLLFLFFAVMLGSSGYMVYVSQQWASDAIDVGKGHSKFPPQTEKRPEGAAR